MVLDAYQGTLKIADLYYLKDGVNVDVHDVMVKTGVYHGERAEVDKMGKNYSPNDVIGVSDNRILADQLHSREITLAVHGPIYGNVIEDVDAGDELMGASNEITETFDGDNTAQQQITIENVPVDSVTSVTETIGSTVLTEVTGTPTTGQYSIDKDTGIIIIGGTSVSGTDNYEVVYEVDRGGFKKLVSEITETITVESHEGLLSEEIDFPLYVESTAGTTTGIFTPIYSGTPTTTEVLVDRANQKLVFAAADAVTEAVVVYKTGYKSCAKMLKADIAGEKSSIYFKGVD